jgi:sugar phosphate permease
LNGDAHFSALHLFSEGLIIGGFILIGAAWKVLYQAQRTQQVATTGPYAYLRHPQYTGFILIMLGFLVQWPTLLTLLMFPSCDHVRAAGKAWGVSAWRFGEGYLIFGEDAGLPRLALPVPRNG